MIICRRFGNVFEEALVENDEFKVEIKGIDELRQSTHAISQIFDPDVVQPEISTLRIEEENDAWSPER